MSDVCENLGGTWSNDSCTNKTHKYITYKGKQKRVSVDYEIPLETEQGTIVDKAINSSSRKEGFSKHILIGLIVMLLFHIIAR